MAPVILSDVSDRQTEQQCMFNHYILLVKHTMVYHSLCTKHLAQPVKTVDGERNENRARDQLVHFSTKDSTSSFIMKHVILHHEAHGL